MGVWDQFKTWLKYRKAVFDLEVTIWQAFPNDVYPTTYPGRYELETIFQQHGRVERRYTVLRSKWGAGPFATSYSSIPYFDLLWQQYTLGRKHINLYQVDKDTYFPISFEEGAMFVNIPIYVYETEPALDEQGAQICAVKQDDKGNFLKLANGDWDYVLDDKGAKVPLMRYKMDKEGKPVPKLNERKEPIITRYEKKLLWDTRVVMQDGKEVQIPKMRANRTYDADQWTSNELVVANEAAAPEQNGWQKYGHIIVGGLTIVSCLIIAWFTISKIDSLGASITALAEAIKSGGITAIKGVAAQSPNLTPPPA